MSTQRCGFCTILSNMFRKAMCIRSRRGSSESHYRDLDDQVTLKNDEEGNDDEDDYLVQEVVGETQALIDNEIARPNLYLGRFLTMRKRRKNRRGSKTKNEEEEALVDDLQIGQVQCMLHQAATWNFNAFRLETVSGGRCLMVLCVHLFHEYGLITHFNLDVIKLWKLFSLIDDGYRSTNPYHNSVHAADVTQAMHCFLQQDEILGYLTPVEIMSALLAAMAHDMDHPGVNQPFLIATSNHLAALYKNMSVLENHHWRTAVSCLKQSGLLEGLDICEEVEQQISSLILATDISRQQEYLQQFQAHMDNNTLDMTKSDHRHLVLQIALKCADISNPCRPWEISRTWSLKVCEEFYRQGDYERKLKLPITELCDRQSMSIPKIQTGFFKYVVTPLITQWHRFLNSDLSLLMIENLVHNEAKWNTLVAEEQANEKKRKTIEELIKRFKIDMSNNSELLLPLRRGSLKPIRPMNFKERLRRFSVPLNLCQDTKCKEKDQGSLSAELRIKGFANFIGSEHSLQTDLAKLQDDDKTRRDAAIAGSQLRDNLFATKSSDEFLCRTISMPADPTFLANERKIRERSLVMPHILRCALSGKKFYPRRRGSAPAPVASSDRNSLMNLASPIALSHSINGGGRRSSHILSCQQWFAKQYSTQKAQGLPRRSSLPVEVFRLTNDVDYV